MMTAVTYAAEYPGPKLLVVGAIHGNEKCGTVAIQRVMKEIEAKQFTIARGQLTLVPIANPRAYELDQRYVERNLNRYLVPMSAPDCYEARLGNVLCPLLAACDVHLAIHSYTVGGAPFVFVSPNNAKEYDLAVSLGSHTLLTGWEQAYAASGRKAKDAADEEATGSVEYARRFGALAVNIECGQHKDPEAPEVAYHAIRNVLRELDMVDEPKQAHTKRHARVVTVTHVYYRDDLGVFVKDWKHLEPAKKGAPIALRADGSPIAAPEDSFIIMPKADCPIGEEWFYLGTEK